MTFLKIKTPDSTANVNVDNLIGRGGFSLVYKGSLDDDGRVVPVAVKRLQTNQYEFFKKLKACFIKEEKPRYKITKSSVDDTKMEIAVLESIQGNDFILKYYGFARKFSYWYIVSEFCGGKNLQQILYIMQRSSMPKLAPLFILPPMLDALAFIHDKGIVHGDVKPSNILISAEGVPKLVDFGTAVKATVDKPQQLDEKFIGTRRYIPPESFLNKRSCPKRDSWALGLLECDVLNAFELGEIGSLQNDFDNIKQYFKDLCEMGKEGQRRFLISTGLTKEPPINRIYFKEGNRIAAALLEIDVENRPTCKELLGSNDVKTALLFWKGRFSLEVTKLDFEACRKQFIEVSKK